MPNLTLNGFKYDRLMLAIHSTSAPLVLVKLNQELLEKNPNAGDVVLGEKGGSVVLITNIPGSAKGESYQIIDGLEAAQLALEQGKTIIRARYMNKHALRRCIETPPRSAQSHRIQSQSTPVHRSQMDQPFLSNPVIDANSPIVRERPAPFPSSDYSGNVTSFAPKRKS